MRIGYGEYFVQKGKQVYIQAFGQLVMLIDQEKIQEIPELEKLILLKKGTTKLDNGWTPSWGKYKVPLGWKMPTQIVLKTNVGENEIIPLA